MDNIVNIISRLFLPIIFSGSLIHFQAGGGGNGAARGRTVNESHRNQYRGNHMFHFLP